MLLIEDNPADARLVAMMLDDLQNSTSSYDLTHVESLSDGVHRLDTGGFDVVLLDLSLPDGRGVENLEPVQERAAGAPVILVTGRGSERVAVQAMKEGAADYLSKSDLNAEVLHRALHNALEKASYRRKLDQLEVFKATLVATASHELRTPLAIIREYVALVKDEVPGPLNEAQRECLEGALRNCDRLGKLIHNTLDLHRLEHNAGDLRRVGFDIWALLDATVRDFNLQASHKGQSLRLDVPPDLPQVLGDPHQIQQVVVNLVGNALKFTPEQGSVRISAKSTVDAVEILVTDDGPGIPEDDLQRVFEPFAQVDRLDAPGPQGTGLGLAIATRIMDAHDGALTVKSQVGEGSTFTFSIPIYSEAGEVNALIHDHALAAVASGKRLTVLAMKLSEVNDQNRSLIDEVRSVFATTARRRDDSVVAAPGLGLVLGVGETERPGSAGFIERVESAVLEHLGKSVPVLFAYDEIGEADDPTQVLANLQFRPAREVPLRVLVLSETGSDAAVSATLIKHLGDQALIRVASDVLDCMAALGRSGHDVVILEPGTSAQNRLDLVRKIQQVRPHTQVILLTDGPGVSRDLGYTGVAEVALAELEHALRAVSPPARHTASTNRAVH